MRESLGCLREALIRHTAQAGARHREGIGTGVLEAQNPAQNEEAT